MKVFKNGELFPTEDLYARKKQSLVFNKRMHRSGKNNFKIDKRINQQGDDKTIQENAIARFYQKRHSIQEYDYNDNNLPADYDTFNKPVSNLNRRTSTSTNLERTSTSYSVPTDNQINEAITAAKATRVAANRSIHMPSYETVEQAARTIKTAKNMDLTKDAADISSGKKADNNKTATASVSLIRGVAKAEMPKNTIITSNGIKDPIKLAHENARAKRYLRNTKMRRRTYARKMGASVSYKSKAAATAIKVATAKKKFFYSVIIGAVGIILTVIIILMLTIVSAFKPQYSTLTMREIMKIYERAWSNVLTETSMSLTTYDSDAGNGTFGLLYGDPGIDWRACLSVYYAALLTNEEISPETDLELASNASILDNESDSAQGNLFGQVFWLFNDVIDTNAIAVQLPYDSVDPASYYLPYYNDYNFITFDWVHIIPIVHRDIESVMNILGFTEWQKTQARLYYSDPAYDSYFSGIINTLNYGPGTDMVYTAQQELNNLGYTYMSWYRGVPQTTGEVHNWCVIFASWCAYQCGYSNQDGQLGIVPKNNDTTDIYNWYRHHPEAGTVYYCYMGAMSPEEIPIQPGSFIIWERDGDTSHQEHLSMVEAYYPETQTFDTIDGNSYTGPAPDSGYYFVTEIRNRSWDNRIYAVIVPAYPEDSLTLDYAPLQEAIDEGRYPTNYETLLEQFENINIGGMTINGTYDRTVDQVIDEIYLYANAGVELGCFTEIPYHSANVWVPDESYNWSGMTYLVQNQPTSIHFHFYENVDIPDWYFSNGYYQHYQECGNYYAYH